MNDILNKTMSSINEFEQINLKENQFKNDEVNKVSTIPSRNPNKRKLTSNTVIFDRSEITFDRESPIYQTQMAKFKDRIISNDSELMRLKRTLNHVKSKLK